MNGRGAIGDLRAVALVLRRAQVNKYRNTNVAPKCVWYGMASGKLQHPTVPPVTARCKSNWKPASRISSCCRHRGMQASSTLEATRHCNRIPAGLHNPGNPVLFFSAV